MATHSSTLAWKIPWTEEPGRLQSMGSLRVGHHWATKHSTHGISSSHVWMWELECKEDGVPKNWYFQTVVLEKTLESPLDSREIQPVNPKENTLQYSCLENPMGGGAWKAAVHGVTEGWTWLSHFTFTLYFHALEKEMATHSSVLAWRVPGTGEPGGLPPVGSHRVG